MRRTQVVVWGAVVLAAGGCGRAPEYGEVGGTVTLDGKPLAGVLVRFLQEPGAKTFAPTAMAVTDDAGVYRIRSSNGKAGVVTGTYRVTVGGALLPPDPAAAGAKPQPVSAPIPAEYGDYQRTPLSGIQVAGGNQTIDLAMRTAR